MSALINRKGPIEIYLENGQKVGVMLYSVANSEYLTITCEDDDKNVDCTKTIHLTCEEAWQLTHKIGEILEVIDYKECTFGEIKDLARKKTLEVYVVKGKKGEFCGTVCFITNTAADELMSCGNDVVKKNLEQPSRCQVVEDVLRHHINLRTPVTMDVTCPSDILQTIDNSELVAVVAKTLHFLGYEWPVFAAELIDAFLHCGGVAKINKTLNVDHLPIEEREMHSLIEAAYEEAIGYI